MVYRCDITFAFPQKASSTVPIFFHENEPLKNSTYLVEEHIFINCKLTNCRMIYSGGAFEFVNTTFENCQWGFRGMAGDTMKLLAILGMLKPGQMPPSTMPPISTGPVN
jgi:hypothetical protein